MKAPTLRSYLEGGDRRSTGRVRELVEHVQRKPSLIRQVLRYMWDPDAIIAMRAADAVEKITRDRPDYLRRFQKELLGLAEETSQPELRWHLAAMLPRLKLNFRERRRAVTILNKYQADTSSIVKTFALQALFDFSLEDSELRPAVEELLSKALRSGSPAMQARARKLLANHPGRKESRSNNR